MSFNWKFSIWCAVSTDEQTDGESIPKQIQESMSAGIRLGGTHVATYVADGYSRTGYWNLSDARVDIPPLNQCLNDIGTYDVLIMKNYDRLGSLTEMIWNFFAERGRQLYSVQQATEIADPQQYRPAQNTSGIILAKIAGISQAYRLSKLDDAKRVGIPARAKSGKYSTNYPYGYIDNSTKEEYRLELDPVVTHLLQSLVAEYLRGASLEDCAKIANRSGVPGPGGGKWHRSRISYIFGNPFYAGKTFYGRTVRDVTLHDGRHPAMWDIETHEKLVAEMGQRGAYLKNSHHYPLSDILYCKSCGQQMYITRCRTRNKKGYYFYYRCINKGCKQRASLRKEEAHERLVDELTVVLLNAPEIATEPPKPADNSKAISALERQLAKLKTTYETTELYSLDEFTEKARTIKRQIDELRDEEFQRERLIRRANDIRQTRAEAKQMLPKLDHFIQTGTPKQVSNWLGKLCVAYCTYDKQIEVVLKE